MHPANRYKLLFEVLIKNTNAAIYFEVFQISRKSLFGDDSWKDSQEVLFPVFWANWMSWNGHRVVLIVIQSESHAAEKFLWPRKGYTPHYMAEKKKERTAWSIQWNSEFASVANSTETFSYVWWAILVFTNNTLVCNHENLLMQYKHINTSQRPAWKKTRPRPPTRKQKWQWQTLFSRKEAILSKAFG